MLGRCLLAAFIIILLSFTAFVVAATVSYEMADASVLPSPQEEFTITVSNYYAGDWIVKAHCGRRDRCIARWGSDGWQCSIRGRVGKNYVHVYDSTKRCYMPGIIVAGKKPHRTFDLADPHDRGVGHRAIR
jgi:hypothetical protein